MCRKTLIRMDYVSEAYQLPPEYRAMRDLLRQRMIMEYKRTNISNRITSILAQFNIALTGAAPHEMGIATSSSPLLKQPSKQ
jgi:hypothetical protein